ncbi:beta-phosphoglucomutase [Priestia abyssalis]|uniref:beta-phosphoglucomutase n=1 Tax=Priestia abyssalis TaxID=1221450 RepID=UPI00099545B1|nr:beta-phosphoglucomutase [Priestia abyssalis]
MSKIKAVIFDMDGVIADTVELYYIANKRVADRMGAPFSRELNQKLQGISRLRTVEHIARLSSRIFSDAEMTKMADEKNNHYKSLIEQLSPKDVLPGIFDLLTELKRENIKTAVASSSSNARVVLEKLELLDRFDFVVDVKTIQNGKPHPEIFMKAADELGISYENCIAIEDGEAGLAGIQAAGMFSIGVGEHEAIKKADWHVRSTEEISLSELMKRYKKWC